MGSYKFYKLDFDGWANRIGGPNKPGSHWEVVLSEHPEFFRFNQERTKASLVWRRTFPRNYNVDDEPERLPDHQISGRPYDRISRRPLSTDEVQALISVAIELHERALEQKKASFINSPFVTALVASLSAGIGAAVGAILGSP
ncbi:hypothetical protein RB2654_10828 [Rhodobacterales bacterium HTCC2654]|uniref:Uncharacterized protein n=2 Tax=Maritimibacter TaxID=404235 RepID=A3VF71_9RHOB|nr:hypothetical protein RB2654_10828 [Rhodobacterales bacterium HTCC2654] [Maritimibacter alkaliphilus HTCC2654]